MDLSTTLLSAAQGDSNSLSQLEQYANANPIQFVTQLMTILTSGSDENLQFQAGMYLKNLFLPPNGGASQDAATEKWKNLPLELREQIKAACLQGIQSPLAPVRLGVARLFAAASVLQFCQGLWFDVIITLKEHVLNKSLPDHLRITAIDILGWVCDDIVDFDDAAQEEFKKHGHEVLTAVIFAMQPSETNADIRAKAANALYNTLEFVENSFDVEHERNLIMKAIFDTATANDANVRAGAYGCLVSIAELYYDKLPSYITKIFELTNATLLNPQEESEPKLQALEFWSTLADLESEILESEDADSCINFVPQACSAIVPTLLACIVVDPDVESDDTDHSETISVSVGAASCLRSVATCVGDDIVPVVMPFVTSNVFSEDWRMREASIMAFGQMMSGPRTETVIPLLTAVPELLKMMRSDPSLLVRDTASWSLGNLCEMHAAAVTAPATLAPVVVGALSVLEANEPASVASSACWMLHSIALAIDLEDCDPSASLQDFFERAMTALLATSERPDGDERYLRMSAIEAVNTFIKAAPESANGHLLNMIPTFLNKLSALIQMQPQNPSERQSILDQEGLVCTIFVSVTNKLSQSLTPDLAEAMMQGCLAVLDRAAAADIVVDDALLAVSALINAREEVLPTHMPRFAPHLARALSKSEEAELCGIAVGVVSDCCHVLQHDFVPYMSQVVELLMLILRAQGDKKLRLQVLSTFSDVATVCGVDFFPVLPVLMPVLRSAASASVDTRSPEAVEYYHSLCSSVLDACVGVVYAFDSVEDKATLPPEVQGYTEFMVSFLVHVSTVNPPIDTLRTAVGLTFDLIKVFGSPVGTFIAGQQALLQMLRAGQTAHDEDISQISQRALAMLGQ